MATMMWVHIIGVLQYVSSCLAQAPASPTDFCRRYGHQTAVIDRKLYIDGGWWYGDPISQYPTPTMNQYLSYDELNVVNNYGFPSQYANLTKNSSIPAVAGGVLWQDEVNKVFWLYGGEFAAAPSTFELWGYDVILNQWNTSTVQDPTAEIQRVSYGAGTASSEAGLGFYYGGYLNNLTNPTWTGPPMATSNLLIFDMDTGLINNSTGYNDTGIAEGTMVYIPASSAGILIYFGGVTYPYGTDTVVGVPLDTIFIYDIGDANWHTQTATGSIPDMRRHFCSGAAWPQDQSSYNIYIYGGFGFGNETEGFDDVYILTMPAFEWIKWYSNDPPAQGSPHGLASCNVIDNAQMIIMGGNFTYDSTVCDVPMIQGQHNLNLGQLDATDAMWYRYLPNITTYQVPPAIVNVTGGDTSGRATQIQPVGGWNDARVAVYFGEQASFNSRSPTRLSPTPTVSSTPPSSTPPTPSPSRTGIIIGGAVGGVAFLLLVTYLSWHCLGKRRTQANNVVATPDPVGRVPEKYSVSLDPPSTVRSASLPGQQEYMSHSPPVGMPPLQTEHAYYHPGYGPPPRGYYTGHQFYPQPGYPLVDNRPYEVAREISHEMPTVNSPHFLDTIKQMPMRSDGEVSQE